MTTTTDLLAADHDDCSRSGDDGPRVRMGSRVARASAVAPHLRFFYIHMMKTGGTTFGWQARANFRPAEVFPQARRDDPYRAYMFVAEPLSLPEERRRRVRLYMGHYPFMLTELLGGGFVTLTMLRDPVERTISFLKHWQRLHRDAGRGLEELYDDPFDYACFIQNHQSRLLSLTPEDGAESFLDVIEVDDARLELAKANLDRVDVVGIHAHYAEFLEELATRYSWHFDPVPQQRVGELTEISEHFRQRITEDNAADIVLYEHALRRRRESKS